MNKCVIGLLVFFVCTCEKKCFENHEVIDYTVSINLSNRHVVELGNLPHFHDIEKFDDLALPKINFIYDNSYLLDSVYRYNLDVEILKNRWKSIFSKYNLDTLRIFFFDLDTISKYTWDKVRTDYKILARYDLTMENIIDLEGIVPYPLQDSTVKIYYPEGLNPFED